jgi:plasmid stability protein
MAQVIVRNLDDGVVERLKQSAREKNQSLEQRLRDILTEAAKPSRAQLLADFARIRAMSRPTQHDTTDFIREDRDRDEPRR